MFLLNVFMAEELSVGIYLSLYNKLSYARVLIGSHL